MAKQGFFSKDSIVTTGKAIVVGIVTSLITAIPAGIGFALKQSNVIISWIMYALAFVLYLFTWGFFAKVFWKWK